MTHHSNRRRSPRGMVLPLTGITFFAMICFAGLALDTGHVFIVGQQLQAAGDAAALSGAALVQTDTSTGFANTINKTIATAGKNKSDQAFVSLSGSDIQIGNYNRGSATFTANTAPYNAVKVTTRATTNLLFAPVVNLVLNPGSNNTSFNTSNVSRQAIAMAGGSYAAGVIALDPSRTGLAVNGNITLRVTNGGIQVNSTPASVDVKGNSASIVATSLRGAGTISAKSGTIPSKTIANTNAVPDPLAALAAPNKNAVTNQGTLSINDTATHAASPGYYPGGITLKKGTLNLAPGVYIVGGPAGLTVSGGTLNAPGVMLYITTDAAGTNWGGISLGGTMNLSPPTSGTYKDVVLFADRAMPYSKGITLGGNATTSLAGTVYMPSQPVSLQGTSAFHVGNQLIVATIHLGGTPDLIVDYDGRNPVTANEVFLVK